MDHAHDWAGPEKFYKFYPVKSSRRISEASQERVLLPEELFTIKVESGKQV